MSSPERLRAIVNADDFGLSDDTVAATIECFEAGAMTSATIMPAQPASEAALAFAREHPAFGFGVHLTFTGDVARHPLSDPSLVPTLVDGEGRLLGVQAFRARALLRRLSSADLEREVEAQVRWVRDRGVEVSHVDSHRHLHKFPPFRAALRRALPRLGITRLRGVQDVYLRRRPGSPTWWVGGRARRRVVDGFESTDHFFMPAKDEPPWAGPLLGQLPRLGTATLEIGVHPGRAEPWRDRDRRETIELVRALGDRATLVDWRSLAP
jgi:predicted glycoside hydrolase/deacetylase ChbG (UPF0249 family)